MLIECIAMSKVVKDLNKIQTFYSENRSQNLTRQNEALFVFTLCTLNESNMVRPFQIKPQSFVTETVN